jgi:hypothetical protein
LLAASLLGMRAFLASVVLASVVATGCQSTGGKILGPLTVAAAISSGYLVSTAGAPASIENGRIVEHDDHRFEYGSMLGAGAVIMTGLWFLSEVMHRESRWHVGGGGGGSVVVAPAPIVVAPAPAPVVVVPSAPERERTHRAGRRSPYERGWHVDPADGQHKLYDRDGLYVGRIDGEGNVWTARGRRGGRVDMGPGCQIECRHSQARKALLGDDLID